MTVQIEIDQKTLAELDEAIAVLQEDREDVFRRAFQELVREKQREAEVRKQYAKAYGKHPQTEDAFDDWEEVQHWED